MLLLRSARPIVLTMTPAGPPAGTPPPCEPDRARVEAMIAMPRRTRDVLVSQVVRDAQTQAG